MEALEREQEAIDQKASRLEEKLRAVMAGNASNNRIKTQSQNPFIRLIRNSIGGGSGAGSKRNSDTIRIKLLDIDNGELSLSASSSSSSESLSISSTSLDSVSAAVSYVESFDELSPVNDCKHLMVENKDDFCSSSELIGDQVPRQLHCHQIRRQRSKSCCTEITGSVRKLASHNCEEATASNKSLCDNVEVCSEKEAARALGKGQLNGSERRSRRKQHKHFSQTRHKCHGKKHGKNGGGGKFVHILNTFLLSVNSKLL